MGWLFDPAHWSGSTGIPLRLLEHLGYTLLTMVIAALIAIPLGAFVGHTGKGGFVIVGLSNALRALPTTAVLILVVLWAGLGDFPVYVALVLLAIPPIMAGTYAGVRAVDPATVDAARGVGMRESGVLLQVEIPNALPLIYGGFRGAALQVVATATIAAYTGAGGLGRFVFDGLALQDFGQMLAGAVLVALLAVLVDLGFAGLQRLTVSPGLRPVGTGGKK
ncbi:osmoprotectant transport system permease protein [Lentzea albidocapillata subsp. violacea]|uniref:Osmoprotectant transport system permease protein n=1 Tax=Lentzea albidocapillata subsp. violacea TaxID=128104 RepID=A0A1G8WZU9_9PSEU|nr:ABC transporter permease [Lentzea albidocapillata]SDJ83741.1 osmoprotectant transport system permease protein [Lentzea albidocapillata subsp. violacea]